jgi:hypothetical protein
MAMGQLLLRELRFFPVSVIPPMLHTLFIYMLLLPEGQTGEGWERSKSNTLPEIGEYWTEKYFHFRLSRVLNFLPYCTIMATYIL